VLDSNCKNNTIGPHNTNYPGLQQQLSKTTISTRWKDNLWNRPIVQAPLANLQPDAPSNISHIFRIESPSEYHHFIIPFDIEPTQSEPLLPVCELSEEILNSLKQKDKDVSKIQDKLSCLPTDEQRELQDLLEQKFLEWLQNSKHVQQIEQLLTLSTKHSPSVHSQK
jgi:TBCC domain-containing protein 1